MTLAILETAIYINDLDAAESFYGDLLGMDRIMRSGNRHVFYRCRHSVLLIFNPNESSKQNPNAVSGHLTHGTTGRGHFCFQASLEEQDRWEKQLNQAGYPTQAVVNWPNGARSLYFNDPGNNSLEFAEPKLWGFDA